MSESVETTTATESSAPEAAESQTVDTSVQDSGNAETSTEQSTETEVGSGGDVNSGFDEDFVRFAEAKGYYSDGKLVPDKFQMSIKAQREMEKRMGQLQSDVDRYKRLELENANLLVNSEPAEDKNPIEQYNEVFGEKVSMILGVFGFTDQDQLRQQQPEIYANLVNEYNMGKMDATAKMAEWQLSQRDKQSQKESAQRILDDRSVMVKNMSTENKAKFLKDNPRFYEDVAKSGVGELVMKLAKFGGFSPDLFWADNFTAPLLAKFAKAEQLISSGEYQKQAKQEIEKAISKAKEAELPATDDPLPDDHTIFRNVQSRGAYKSVFDYNK